MIRSPKKRKRSAVSLVEILIAIAIIAVLAGLTIPAISKVRQAANRTASANNLKQIALAAHNYEAINGVLPVSAGWANKSGKPVHNDSSGVLFLHLLPQLGEDAAYRRFYSEKLMTFYPGFFGAPTWIGNGPPWKLDPTTGVYSCGIPAYRGADGSFYFKGNPSGTLTAPTFIKTYLSPSDPSKDESLPFMTSYMTNKAILRQRTSISKIKAGSSRTLMLAEGYSVCTASKSRKLDWTQGAVEAARMVGFGPPFEYVEDASTDPANAALYCEFGVETSATTGLYYDSTGYWKSVTTNSPTFQVRPDLTYGTGPSNNLCAINLPQALSGDSIQVALCDGSVHRVSSQVNYATWVAAIKGDDPQVTSLDFGD